MVSVVDKSFYRLYKCEKNNMIYTVCFIRAIKGVVQWAIVCHAFLCLSLCPAFCSSSYTLTFLHASTAACVTLTEGSVFYSRNHPPKHSGPVIVFNVESVLIHDLVLCRLHWRIPCFCGGLYLLETSHTFKTEIRAARTSLSLLCAIWAYVCVILHFVNFLSDLKGRNFFKIHAI